MKQIDMTPSPTPWRIEHTNRQGEALIKAANEEVVATCHVSNAAAMVAAVNNFSRLNEAVKKLIDACAECGYKDGGTAACFACEHHLYDAIWYAKAAIEWAKEGGAE